MCRKDRSCRKFRSGHNGGHLHFRTALLTVALWEIFIPSGSFAQSPKELIWEGSVSLNSYDCDKSKIDAIVIKGPIILVHPDDRDPFQPALSITIKCNNLTFTAGSSINSTSHLDIRIRNNVSGDVKITGTRGIPGKDAPKDTPQILEIWKVRKAKSGGNGGNGQGGDPAVDTSLKYPGGNSSSPGYDGGRGGDGVDGNNGVKGANGTTGANGNNIRLIAGNFSKDATIQITSAGGHGGAGGLARIMQRFDLCAVQGAVFG